MISGFSIGYINYTIFLMLFTGILMLRIDVKGYKDENRVKERKTTLVLGWINVAFGVMAFVGNWAYQRFTI